MASGQHKAIEDEGMPIYGRSFMKGCMYIKFNIEFPNSSFFSPECCRKLESILPPKPAQATEMEIEECEETVLHDVNIEDEMRRRKHQKQQEAYDDDDEEEAGGNPRVQCAQQ